jgi:hypothetical protein
MKSDDNRFYGMTPDVRNEESVLEIFNMPYENLGGGVIRFPGVVKIDRSTLLPY